MRPARPVPRSPAGRPGPQPGRPSPRSAVEAALERSGLFRDLDEGSIGALARQCDLCSAPLGSHLWRMGGPSEFVAIVRTGIVELSHLASDGNRVVVELLGQDDCTGLLAALGGTAHPLACSALSDVAYVRIPTQTLLQVAEDHPRVLRRAVEEVVPRMLGGFGFMAAMVAGNVEARLALALLRLHELVARELGADAPVAVTRSCLAGIVRTTVESAIRTTSRWQKQGVVRARHGKIELIRPDHLRLLAGLPRGG